jgi:hypothetical protein
LGLPPSITATHELVVPRSIPITLAIFPLILFHLGRRAVGSPSTAKPVGGSVEHITLPAI